MNIIEFFGFVIKPIQLRGKGVLNPEPTGIVNENISCIKQYDVNMWIYKKGDTTIAIDAGYKEYPYIEEEFSKIGVDPKKVEAVFLTHADMDHAGGISDNETNIYPNANIYLQSHEESMLNGKEKRFKVGPIQINNPIKREQDYKLLKDGEIMKVGDICVEIIHIPGHTPGHSAYLIDNEVLFTGDSIALNEMGGHSFFPFYNMNTKSNKESLIKLRDRFSKNMPKIVCTGHSGYTTNMDNLFSNIDISAKGTKRKPFDKKAPRDVFKQ